MPYEILLIDNSRHVQQQLEAVLKDADWHLAKAFSGKEALQLLENSRFDLVLLDLSLPDMGGFLLLQQLHRAHKVPVIALSTSVEESERLRAFNEGADDVISKPLGSLKEVEMRMRAILKRGRPRYLNCAGIQIDLNAAKVWSDGKEIPLPPQQYRLLVALASYPNQLRTHQELLEEIFSEEEDPQLLSIYILIHALRQVLEKDPSNPQRILSIRGRGYYLKDLLQA